MMYPGYFIGYPIGSALGTHAVGKLFHQDGPFWRSLLWAELAAWIWTGGIGYCLEIWGPIGGGVPFVQKVIPDEVGVLGVFLLPPLAAVISYNLWGTKNIEESYFIPPLIEFTTKSISSEASKENIYQFRWNLIRVRF
jgi:hypothetical protein